MNYSSSESSDSSCSKKKCKSYYKKCKNKYKKEHCSCLELECSIKKIKIKIIELLNKTQDFYYNGVTKTTVFNNNIECDDITARKCGTFYNGITTGVEGFVNLNKQLLLNQKGIEINYDPNTNEGFIQSLIQGTGPTTLNINLSGGTVNVGNEVITETYYNSNAYWKSTNNNNCCYGFNTGVNISSNSQQCSAFGYSALQNISSGVNNNAFGYLAGSSVSTAANSVFIGAYSGLSANADNDTFIGTKSGYYQQSAGNNVAVGTFALLGQSGQSNAYFNTAVGYQSMSNSTIGQYNCGFGARSLMAITSGGYNNCFGFNSGYGITTGGSNACVGTNTCYNTTSGSSNSCFGSTSGSNITTGNFNLCLGSNSGPNSTDGAYSNSVCIGNNSTYSASNQIVFGTNEETTFPKGGLCYSNQVYEIGTTATLTLETLISCNSGGSGTSASNLTIPENLPVGFVYEFRKMDSLTPIVNVIFNGSNKYILKGSVATVTGTIIINTTECYLKIVQFQQNLWYVTEFY